MKYFVQEKRAEVQKIAPFVDCIFTTQWEILGTRQKMQFFKMMQHQTWLQISTPTMMTMMMQENTSTTEIPFVSSTSKNEIKEIVNQLNRLQPFMPPKNSMHGAESYVTMTSNK